MSAPPFVGDLFAETEHSKAEAEAERIEIPDWFRKLVPSNADPSGYNEPLFDNERHVVESIRSMPPEEFDRHWLDVLQGYKPKASTLDATPEEWGDFMKDSKMPDRLYGNEFFIYEVKFLNLSNHFWPVFLYKDGVDCFMQATISPMFRGPNGFLVCRYAARCIDTGRRYIPFKDYPPERKR